MKRAKGIIFLCLLLTLIFASTAYAGSVVDRIVQKGELVVGMSGDQPPLNVKASDGKIIGLDVEIAKVMARAMSVKLKIENIPFPELLPALQAGKVDMIISNMTILPERNMKVAFVGPYYISGKGVLTHIEKVTSLQNTDGLNQPKFTIAALKDSTSQKFVESFAPKAKHVFTKSLDESLNLLLSKKVDAVISDHPFCVVSAIRYRDKGLVAGETPFNYEPIGIALSADDYLMVNMVENILDSLKGSGYLKKLKNYWFKDPSWLKRLPSAKESL